MIDFRTGGGILGGPEASRYVKPDYTCNSVFNCHHIGALKGHKIGFKCRHEGDYSTHGPPTSASCSEVWGCSSRMKGSKLATFRFCSPGGGFYPYL